MSWNVELHPALAADDELIAVVGNLPLSFDIVEGETLHRGRNVIRRLHLTAAALIAKRFRRPNLFQSIYYTITNSSKARRAFNNAVELLRRGIDTPHPAAFAEQRTLGLITDCYYFCAEDDAPAIAAPLNKAEQFDPQLATAFALFAAQLHRKGILHGDLNSTNTLYRLRHDGSYRFSVIDINRMKFYAEDHLPPLDECLENLTRFTGRMDLFEHVATAYASEMAEAFGLSSEDLKQRAIARKQLHDQRWRRRKRMLHPFKKKSKPHPPKNNGNNP